MPLTYDAPPLSGALRQGEILADVWIHRVALPASEAPQDTVPNVHSVHHARMIVLHSDCDLQQDFNYRSSQSTTRQADEGDPSVVPEALLCDLYEEPEIRPKVAGSDIFKRIKRNQDERYHRLTTAAVGATGSSLPGLFIDFKKTFGVAPSALYEGIQGRGIQRIAVVPPLYLQDIMHRFFGFQSRVGLPD